MTYVKINDTLYPVISIMGFMKDSEWDDRESKKITLESTYEEVKALFVPEVAWSIVDKEEGSETSAEYDNSEFCLSGEITDHRDGTVSIKMGKLTDLEQVLMML